MHHVGVEYDVDEINGPLIGKDIEADRREKVRPVGRVQQDLGSTFLGDVFLESEKLLSTFETTVVSENVSNQVRLFCFFFKFG